MTENFRYLYIGKINLCVKISQFYEGTEFSRTQQTVRFTLTYFQSNFYCKIEKILKNYRNSSRK